MPIPGQSWSPWPMQNDSTFRADHQLLLLKFLFDKFFEEDAYDEIKNFIGLAMERFLHGESIGWRDRGSLENREDFLSGEC